MTTDEVERIMALKAGTQVLRHLSGSYGYYYGVIVAYADYLYEIHWVFGTEPPILKQSHYQKLYAEQWANDFLEATREK